MTHPVIPPGQSAPAEVIDATHHGGWIIIATAIGLTLFLFCLFIRLYVRLAISPTSGPADYVLIAAGAFAIIQSCLVFWQVSVGLGTSIELISLHHVHQLQKSAFASDVLYLITIYLSKCCVHFVFLQLTPNKYHNRASWAVMGVSTVWLICSIFMIGVNCELNQPWGDIAARCSNMFLRWQLIAAFDIITEICFFLLSLYLVKGLQMPFKQKRVVVGAFALRLPVIAAAALRLHFINTQIHSSNPTLRGVNTVIWTEIQLQYSIIACVCYCLRTFMSVVSTNYGSAAINVEVYDTVNGRSTKGYGVGTQQRSLRSIGNSFALDSATRRKQNGGLESATGGDDHGKKGSLFRPDGSFGKTTISHEPRVARDTDSKGSNDSTRMIINREMKYTVAIEEAQ